MLIFAFVTFVGQSDIAGRTEIIDINSIYLIEFEKPEDTTANLIKDEAEFLRDGRNLSIDFR